MRKEKPLPSSASALMLGLNATRFAPCSEGIRLAAYRRPSPAKRRRFLRNAEVLLAPRDMPSEANGDVGVPVGSTAPRYLSGFKFSWKTMPVCIKTHQ
jgi:hypothetical protein